MVRLPPRPGLSWVPIRYKVNPQASGAQVVPGSSRSSRVGPAPTSRRVLHHFRLVSALSKEGVVVILVSKKDQQQVKILWEAQWEGMCMSSYSSKVFQSEEGGRQAEGSRHKGR